MTVNATGHWFEGIGYAWPMTEGVLITSQVIAHISNSSVLEEDA